MINEIQSLLDEYSHWLADKTTLRALDDWVEITTPYLDRHNDYLQIYTRRENGRLLLTDDGYTIRDLELSGCNLETEKRQDLFTQTIQGFGIQAKNKALVVYATPENFALRKHNLIQAMLAVNDLFYLATPVVESLFLEDVTAWMDGYDIRYIPNVKFTGATGYDYVFDFAIPKSRQQPERLLRAINRPSRETVESFVLAWVDTRGARPPDSRAYAFLNDSERSIAAAISEAFYNYEIRPIPWSLREQCRAELVA